MAKITGIIFFSLVFLMFLLPYLFPNTITSKIKAWANSSINGELSFSTVRLSFFRHFPALTLSLSDFTLKGSAPFQKDTLVSAEEIALGIDLSTVFKGQIKINKIFLTHAFINVQVDSGGRANYNVYTSKSHKDKTASDTSSVALNIEQILIEKSHLVYNDRSIPILIDAKGLNYSGSGELSKAIFDLHTHVEIDSLDFVYNKQPYILSKKIDANLITKINTNSLAFIFEKNDLKINQLPVHFNGSFEFLSNGYNMNFKLNSSETDLYNIFTVLPPEYAQWLAKTDIKGTASINLSLAGQYIASTNTMPNLAFNMQVRDGYIAYAKAPAPVKNLFFNFDARLPSLNADSLHVNIDSLFFNIDKDYFSSVVRITGVNTPDIYARVSTEMDMEKWDKALGIKPYDVKGHLSVRLLADGRYATKVVPKGIRKMDTVISSIPKFDLQAAYRNGYFKYASLPEAIDHINFDLKAQCPDSNYRHTNLAIDNLNATALTSYIKGYFKLTNAENFPIDADIQTVLHLSELKKFIPLDSTDLAGDLSVNAHLKGDYIPARKHFPVMNTTINLQNGSLKTKYYPHPITDIQIAATASSTRGSYKDITVSVKPLSFRFEGQPFVLNADLQNLSDLKYNVTAKGVIDVGRIYQVFAKQGYDVTGFIQTDLTLKGRQSDATAGRYNRLYNSGTLKVRDLALSSDLFPKPFIIKTGVFSFAQDKMKFDAFKAKYGRSDFELNGYLSDVINYIMNGKATLKGGFDLKSNLIVVDEFTAFADNNSKATPVHVSAASNTASTGVVIVPSNLDMTFTAAAQKIKYSGMNIDSFKGTITINKGVINLKETGFKLINAPIAMDASYGSITPQKAFFNYHISAKEFDVHRAYKEIKLFHDLVTSASSAQGIVSLDYQLSGKLDGNMHPLYPSLKGGGVLSIKKVKVVGLKLLSAVSSKTNKGSIKNPDLSKVDIKTTIANNIITIERTKMRVVGFRPRFEGQVSFNGDMNLKFRLGLPPLGIIGIPMKITGTEDHPKIKLGNGGKTDELKETEDTSDEN